MTPQPRSARVGALALATMLLLAACAPAAPSAPTAAPAAPKPTEAAKPAAPAATTAPAAPTVPAATGIPAAKPAAPAATAAPAAKPSVRSLRIAIATDEGTLNPYTYKTGYPGWNMLNLVWDSLMQLDAQNVPQPLLAASVKTTDAMTYDITMRPGIKWHDGKPLTSEDVKFTYEYFIKITHSRFSSPLRAIDTITTDGPERLTIKLKAPNPSFPVRALADAPIIPRQEWDNVPLERTKEIPAKIGSGPYKLIEATDTAYRLEANPDYFLGAPPVGELLFPVIKDLNTALQALRTGEVQAVARELPPEQVQPFSQAPLKVSKGPGFASTLLQFNLERAPFDKTEVRQAIDLAIDKKKLVDTILLGNGTVATPGFVHPDSPNHDPSVQARFDVAKAKQLLDQAGAVPGPDGIRVLNGKPMAFTVLAQSEQPLRIRAAELIIGMLKEVGIQTTVKVLDNNAVIDLVWKDFDVTKPRDYELAMFGWSAPVQVDPARVVDFAHSDPTIGTGNIGAYKNPEADKIGDQVRAAVDPAQRKQLIGQYERILATDVPFVMLYFQDLAYAYRADAYDGWLFQKGQGIITKLSFLPGFGR
ncbi:MAG: peptide ABC transporter substrate-binding protein [Chloroflexi bacterium]|nr:peptide ABC transporter substrate-binding protein [Chloroflexota bacterium]